MDRDKRYDRIKLAFEGMVEGKGEEAAVGDLAEVREWSEGGHHDFGKPALNTDSFYFLVLLGCLLLCCQDATFSTMVQSTPL